MKKRNLLIVAVLSLVSLFVTGCEEDFNPKSALKDQYLLFCVIKGDSTAQMAVLGKTYDTDGYIPALNTVSPEIAGAKITVNYDKVSYQMKDTLIPRTDTSRYTDAQKAYYMKVKAPAVLQPISIKAELPNGVTLSATAKIPPRLYIKRSAYTVGSSSDRSAITSYSISWETTAGYLFASRFRIAYKKDGVTETLYKDIPQDYLLINGKLQPVYPSVSRMQGLSFKYPSIDSAMVAVAGDDAFKSNYRILSATFELITMDENLAKYYSSTNGFMDEFSVRLDENIYSNIVGGLGVFGAITRTEETILFDPDYIQSFGYRIR